VSETVGDTPGLVGSLRRWQTTGVAVFMLLVLAFPIYKLTERSRLDQALRQQQAAQLSLGGQLWGLNCASCHGDQGQGVDAPALNSKEFLAAVSDEQMAGIVRGGIPGSEMPAWLSDYGGPLTEQQIEAVVAFVRSWQPNAPSRPDWRDVGGTG
jgi:mono/diheme cytochrome c family protein